MTSLLEGFQQKVNVQNGPIWPSFVTKMWHISAPQSMALSGLPFPIQTLCLSRGCKRRIERDDLVANPSFLWCGVTIVCRYKIGTNLDQQQSYVPLNSQYFLSDDFLSEDFDSV